MYSHICIPSDGSELSGHAVEQALMLARTLRARVTLLAVIEPFHVFAFLPDQITDTPERYRQHARAGAERHLQAAEAKANAQGIVCDTVVVEDEHPYRAIIDIANERGCELIAMASHGRRGVQALVLGSQTVKVLTHSTIPVLVYRQPAQHANE